MSGDFPLRVRGVDTAGQPFHLASLADNLSAGGLYCQLPRSLAKGAPLFAVVQVNDALVIAARATVSRVELRPRGLCGVGVQFARTRILAH